MSFPPDSPLVDRVQPSPNHQPRVGVAEVRLAGTTVREVWNELVRRHPAAAVDADSVRAACKAWGVSPTTVFRAYHLLENRGMIKARPRSGYFVSPSSGELPRQRPWTSLSTDLKTVNISDLVFEVLKTIKQAETVPLGSAFLSPALFPMARVGKSCKFRRIW